MQSQNQTLPVVLQKTIDDFFTYNSTPEEIQKNLWDMLESATAGVDEIGLDTSNVLHFMFFYKTLNEFLAIVYLFHNQTATTNE